MSDIDYQFSIAGIQFSILVLPRNNFERFLKLYNTSHRQGNVTITNGKTSEQCMDKIKSCYSFIRLVILEGMGLHIINFKSYGGE